MKAPSQDFTVLSRGLFYFPALSRLRGAVALFVAWVCVYPPTMQRACCNSPTAAREGFDTLVLTIYHDSIYISDLDRS